MTARYLNMYILLTAALNFEKTQSFATPYIRSKCRLENGNFGTCRKVNMCRKPFTYEYSEECWTGVSYNPFICCDQSLQQWQQVTQIDRFVNKSVGFESKKVCEELYPKKFQFGTAMELIGGTQSSNKEFPHMAALGQVDGNKIKWACGGSLISEKFVLTAAHCVTNRKLSSIKIVRLGNVNLIESNNAYSQDFLVLRTIRHPEYKASSQYHDIALIELDTKGVTFSDYIKPACLHTEKTNGRGIHLVATGWGSVENNGPMEDHLRKVSLTLFDHNKCSTIYAQTRRLERGIDEESQICAGGNERDTCQGDSGGPLQVKNLDRVGGYTIVGVTSFGKVCGLSGSPGVYTRVSYYIQWIESIVWTK